MTPELPQCDVAIVGGGPAGIAAALTLRQRGHRVTIIEREAALGGVPRHCAHSPFGMHEFGRVLSGPAYARRLAAEAEKAGVHILLQHSVTRLFPDSRLQIARPSGIASLAARRVLLATGARETPRSARLVSGARPIGIITTGALQHTVNLEHLRPMNRALIVGTELVSFSALLTCRANGITPVAMIDERRRVVARSMFALYPWIARIPLHLGVKIVNIHGSLRVEGATLQRADGSFFDIACDGVVFTGRFTAEGSLARCSHLEIDPGTGGPVVDQYARTSDPAYFAAGNMLHPVETGGWCFREGGKIGSIIADDLVNRLPDAGNNLKVSAGDGIRYVLPQRVTPGAPKGFSNFQLRALHPLKANLILEHAGTSLWSRKRQILPERRILVPLSSVGDVTNGTDLIFRTSED